MPSAIPSERAPLSPSPYSLRSRTEQKGPNGADIQWNAKYYARRKKKGKSSAKSRGRPASPPPLPPPPPEKASTSTYPSSSSPVLFPKPFLLPRGDCDHLNNPCLPEEGQNRFFALPPSNRKIPWRPRVFPLGFFQYLVVLDLKLERLVFAE